MVRDQPAEMRKSILDATPMGRIGKPEEVAKGVLYLASDDASYVAAALLPIDRASPRSRQAPARGARLSEIRGLANGWRMRSRLRFRAKVAL